MDFSLIITCYNEAPHLRESFEILKRVLKETGWRSEFIFVEDFSTDSTRDVIDSILKENPDLNIKKIFHQKNEGRGQSVNDGIRAAIGRVVGFLDIDLEIDAHYLVPAVVLIREKQADFVMARRIYKYSIFSFTRAIVSRGYNFLMRLLLGLPFSDTEAGFKFFDREKILPLLDKLQDKRWFWDTEIVACAHRAGLKIILLPTLFIRRPDKKSTVRLLRDSWIYFVSLLKFRKRYRASK